MAKVRVAAVAPGTVRIESLDQQGRGVAHRDGKVIFIEGALPGETVTYAPYRSRDRFELAEAVDIVKSSPLRSSPRCAHFGVCGGCSLQHLDIRAQIAVKQRVLEDNLWHIGRVRPDIILPAVHGPAWGYRGRARFSAANATAPSRTTAANAPRHAHFLFPTLPMIQTLRPRVSDSVQEANPSDRQEAMPPLP